MLRVIAEAVEAERRKKQAETQSETKKKELSDNKLTHSPATKNEPKKPERVTQKAAEILAAIAEAVEAERRRKIAEQMQGNENRKEEKQTVQFVEPSVKDNSKLATQKAAEILAAIAEAVEMERRRKIAERENVANQHSAKMETCQLIDTTAKNPEPTKKPERVTQKAAEILAAIAEAVEAAKAEKNRVAAVKQHSGGCDNKLTDPQPTKQPERVTQKAAEILAAIAEAVEAERLRKQKEAAEARSRTESGTFIPTCNNKLSEVVNPEPTKKPERVTQKAAEIFNTNRHHLVLV